MAKQRSLFQKKILVTPSQKKCSNNAAIWARFWFLFLFTFKNLEKNTTQNFTITYTATLNKDAVLGQSGNTNAVSVTYKNTGDVDRKTEPTGTPKVFTYGIDLLKKGEGVDKLVGVKFTLTDENGKGVNVEKNDSNNFYTPGGRSNTVTTGDDGKIYIRGLKPGTYKLTETKTNNGYVLLKNPVVIVITQTSAETGAATATGPLRRASALQGIALTRGGTHFGCPGRWKAVLGVLFY